MRSIWIPAAAPRRWRATSSSSVSRETLNRAHHEPSVGLVALAVRLHVARRGQVCVHGLGLHGAHRAEVGWPGVLKPLRGRAVRHAVPRGRAALAIGGGGPDGLLAGL